MSLPTSTGSVSITSSRPSSRRQPIQGLHRHAPGTPGAAHLKASKTSVTGNVEGLKKFTKAREPVPRPQFLPGVRPGDAVDPGKETGDNATSARARRSSTSTSATSAASAATSWRPTWTRATSPSSASAINNDGEVGYPYMIMPDHVLLRPPGPARLR